MAMAAHPADLSARIADHQSVFGNILDNYGTGSDETVPAKFDAANDRGIRADCGAASEGRVFVE